MERAGYSRQMEKEKDAPAEKETTKKKSKIQVNLPFESFCFFFKFLC
jgi:hypothetical protein